MGKIVISNQKSQAGFTLVEVLVSVVVISILAIGIFQLMGWNFSAAFLARERTKAVAIAQEKLDILTIEMLSILENNDSVVEQLQTIEGFKSSEADLFNGSGDRTVFHWKETSHNVDGFEVTGYQIMVVSFYWQGKHHVRVEYFIEG